MDDLFDDWQIPPDTEWDDFKLPEELTARDELLERMGRRLTHLRREINEIQAAAMAEKARIDAVARDRLYGPQRAEKWVSDTLAAAQRAVVDTNRYAPRTMKLFCGVQVRASGTGGQPVIRDRQAYAEWATRHDYIKRDATVEVPWETLLLAVQAMRQSLAEDVGGRSDGAPGLIAKLADDLDRALEEQTKFTTPSYAEKGGRIRWVPSASDGEGGWVDVETGDVIPGLAQAERGWNVNVVTP